MWIQRNTNISSSIFEEVNKKLQYVYITHISLCWIEKDRVIWLYVPFSTFMTMYRWASNFEYNSAVWMCVIILASSSSEDHKRGHGCFFDVIIKSYVIHHTSKRSHNEGEIELNYQLWRWFVVLSNSFLLCGIQP